tara:strand:+ start:121947 stop:122516 length:570 start_codon:yes stop_codon:yes gene_type:complete
MRNIYQENKGINPLKLDQPAESPPPKWLPFAMAASWFGGLFLLFWMYSLTDISLTETLKWFAFFALILTLIPYKMTVRLLPIEFHFMVVINIMGLGPVLTSLFLVINFIFASSPVEHNHPIKHFHAGKEGFNGSDLVLVLKDNALANQKKFRSFDYGQYVDEVLDSKVYKCTIKSGLFGYDVLVDPNFE